MSDDDVAMESGDWSEALYALEAGPDVDTPERRHALANIVRDEVERLQRVEAQARARGVQLAAAGKRAVRERYVTLAWSAAAHRLYIAVAPYDSDWLAQMFLDAKHAAMNLRFRLDPDSGDYASAAFDEADARVGDVVFLGVRAERMARLDVMECRFTGALRVGEESAEPLPPSSPLPPSRPIDVST